LMGAGGGRAVQSLGGTNTITIAQNNLPNVNLVGGNHSHGVTDPGHNHTVTAVFHDATGDGWRGGRIQSTDRSPRVQTAPTEITLASATTGISINASGNLSFPLNGGVTQAPITVEPRSLACNYFVYLGQ
jgi:hypothetical protein